MKKLMKAIAFATVMCMLLSVSAFASMTAVKDEAADHVLDVTVNTGDSSNQVALLVLKAGKTPQTATNEDILYIDQKASEGDGTFAATFADLSIAEDVVDVYAGYANNGSNPAVSVLNVELKTTQKLVVTLSAEGITKYPDAAAVLKDMQGAAYEPVAEVDRGALVYATVQFNLADGDVVKKVGWQFANGEDMRIIDYDWDSSAIESGSPVQLGVAFTNGTQPDEDGVQVRTSFVTADTDVKLFFGIGATEDAEDLEKVEAVKEAE